MVFFLLLVCEMGATQHAKGLSQAQNTIICYELYEDLLLCDSVTNATFSKLVGLTFVVPDQTFSGAK